MRTFLGRAYGKDCKSGSIAIHNKANLASSSTSYDDEVAQAEPIYVDLRELFLKSLGTMANLISILSKPFGLSMSESAAKRLFVRMQWDLEISKEFVPASYRPLLHSTDVFLWPLQYGVTSWTYCSTCGRRVPRKQSAAIGVQFVCPKTIILNCRDKADEFATGCAHNC